MKLIKQLIMSRGLTLKRVAAELGVGEHMFGKVVNHSPHWTGRGFYETRHVREKIAIWLGCPYEHVWGQDAEFYLKKMIAEEIGRRFEEEKNKKLQALGIL